MQLEPRFTVTIDGTLHRVRQRHLVTPGSLPHLIAALLAGDDVPDSAWAAFGLRVIADIDTDQGPDEPTVEDHVVVRG